MRYPVPVPPAPTWQTEIVTGRSSILAHAPALVALTERTGQPGMMDHLDYFLHFKDALKKIPHVVLLRAGSGEPEAALLIHEYKLLGCPTGIFATDDVSGRRALIAPAGTRTAAGRRAAEALMRQGARVVFLSFVETAPDETALAQRPVDPASNNWRLATQRRMIRAFLPLEATYDATLARLGQHTRRNMRAFRRKAEAQLGAAFVPDAKLSRFEFRALNRASTYAVSDAEAGWRYDAITTVPGGFLSGVRDRAGRWLALAGGRRHHDTVEIDWQMNRDDLPALSLGTVLRAYLLEHEVMRGTGVLFFEAGTPHAMRLTFHLSMVRDLAIAKPLPGVRHLRRFVPLLRSYINRRLPQSAYILRILIDPRLTWRPWS